jgi:hypothetical protein
MHADPDLSVLSSGDKDALIRTLMARLDDLTERVAALEAENAALRDRLSLPPKTSAELEHAAVTGAQGQWGAEQPAHEQGASRCGPRTASEPDAAS